MDLKKVIIGMGIAANAVLMGAMLAISSYFYLFAYRVEFFCALCVVNIALLTFAGKNEKYLVRFRVTGMFVLLGVSLLFFGLSPKMTIARAKEAVLAQPEYQQATVLSAKGVDQATWPGFLTSKLYQLTLETPQGQVVVTVNPSAKEIAPAN